MGSEWIATMLMVPHTRTTSVMAVTAAGLPVTSNATSAPSPSVHSCREADEVAPGADDLESEAPEHLDAEGIDLDDRHARPAVATDQRDQAADRPAAEHQHGVAGLHLRARHVVRRDGQRLDHARRDRRRAWIGHLDQPRGRHGPVLLHAARDIHAQHLEL